MVEGLRKKKKEEVSKGLERRYGIPEIEKKLKGAGKKREDIERDLVNMSPEFGERYGGHIQKDLIAARNEEAGAEEELRARKNAVVQAIPKELEDALSRGMLEEGKVEAIFMTEKSRIQEKSQKKVRGIERDFEHKRNELYQSYLKGLGEICDHGMEGIKRQINSLPQERRSLAIALHELEDSLRELEKVRRRFAVELKRKIEERKVETMEKRLSLSLENLEEERTKRKGLEKEVGELRRALTRARSEARSEGKEWKKSFELELGERLEKEIRKALEKELRMTLEKEIRDELEAEFKRREKELSARQRRVKRTVREPAVRARLQFVRCPSCSTRIEVESDERPLVVMCPGCGSEYTLREKHGDTGSQEEGFPDKKPGPTGQPALDSQANGPADISDSQDMEQTPQVETASPPEPKERERADTLPPPHANKEVVCPYCGKTHTVPASFSRKLTCSCGRRIRTT